MPYTTLITAALVALSLSGCGLSCEDACAKAVACGSFSSAESTDCVATCSSAADDSWLTCMDQDDCALTDTCSL